MAGNQNTGDTVVRKAGSTLLLASPGNNTGNYNCIVVGRSGAGKSVFMNELMRTMWSQGGRVYVLDVGKSFEKTVLSLGGEIIQFTRKNSLCVNPFSGICGNSDQKALH